MQAVCGVAGCDPLHPGSRRFSILKPAAIARVLVLPPSSLGGN